MIYTIQATDDFLGKEKLQKLLKNDKFKTDLMNTVEFDCTENNIDKILEYCNTAPFFTEHKVAILKNPIFLTSEKSKEDFENFINGLLEYIENPCETTIMVIYSNYEKLDERKKIVKKLKSLTKFVAIQLPTTAEIKVIINDRLSKRDCKISDEASALLIEKVGNNLSDIISEVEKLSLFKPGDNLTIEDVEEFVVCNIDSNVFELSNAILDREHSHALQLFEDMTKGGLEPIVLVSILANQYRIALLTKIYAKNGVSADEVAKKLKIHPYRIKLAGKLRYNERAIKEILVKLANLDYRIKTGRVNKFQAIKIFILNV